MRMRESRRDLQRGGWDPPGAYQGIIDALIWLFVVVVPIVAPIALVVWAVWYFGWRRRRKGPV